MRRWIPLGTYLGLATLAAAVALAGVGERPRAARAAAAISASGALQISNSRDGLSIFGAHGISPGESTAGTVAIEGSGSAPVELVLRRGELSDSPGLGGGALSSRLELTVLDVTEPSGPRTVYAGPLDSMPERPAGRLAPGRSRTYEFVATLPDAGGPDFENEVQGASTEVAYSWIAEAPGGGEVAAPSGGEAGGGGGTTGGGSGGAPSVPTPPGASGRPGLGLALTRVRRSVRADGVFVWAGCDERCRIEVRGRLGIGVDGRHRVAPARLVGPRPFAAGPQRLRILVPRGLRRWARAAGGPVRLRAELTFRARDPDGERAALHRTLRLRLRPRR